MASLKAKPGKPERKSALWCYSHFYNCMESLKKLMPTLTGVSHSKITKSQVYCPVILGYNCIIISILQSLNKFTLRLLMTARDFWNNNNNINFIEPINAEANKTMFYSLQSLRKNDVAYTIKNLLLIIKYMKRDIIKLILLLYNKWIYQNIKF